MLPSVSLSPEVNGTRSMPETQRKKRHKRTFPSFFTFKMVPNESQPKHDEPHKRHASEGSEGSNHSTNYSDVNSVTPLYAQKKQDLPQLIIPPSDPSLIIPRTPSPSIPSTKDSIGSLNFSVRGIAPMPALFGDTHPKCSSVGLSECSPTSSLEWLSSTCGREPALPERHPTLHPGNVVWSASQPFASQQRASNRRPGTGNTSYGGDYIYGTDKLDLIVPPANSHLLESDLVGNGGKSLQSLHEDTKAHYTRRGMHDRPQLTIAPTTPTTPAMLSHHYALSSPRPLPPPPRPPPRRTHSRSESCSHPRSRADEHCFYLKQSAVPVDLHQNRSPNSWAPYIEMTPPSEPRRKFEGAPPDVAVGLPSPTSRAPGESLSRSQPNSSSDIRSPSNGPNTHSPLVPETYLSIGVNTPHKGRYHTVAPSKSKSQSSTHLGPETTRSNQSQPAWPWEPPANWSGPPQRDSDVTTVSPSCDETAVKQPKKQFNALRRPKSASKAEKQERKPLYAYFNLSTASLRQSRMPNGRGDGMPSVRGIESQGETCDGKELVVTMQNLGSEEWEQKNMVEVIPQLRQLKTKKTH